MIITFGLYANREGPDGKISDATGLKLETVVITPKRGEPLTIPHAEYQ